MNRDAPIAERALPATPSAPATKMNIQRNLTQRRKFTLYPQSNSHVMLDYDKG